MLKKVKTTHEFFKKFVFFFLEANLRKNNNVAFDFGLKFDKWFEAELLCNI